MANNMSEETMNLRWTALLLLVALSSTLGCAEEVGILTPPPTPRPRINGAKIYGVRPRHPFLYTIPATGTRPMTFSAQNLPKGLKLDPKTGIITGAVKAKGEYKVTLRAKNSLGSTERVFKIVAGDKLALTPPMGWSTWYMAFTNISDKLVREQADAMVSSGLINHGYAYVNIDDGWNIKPGSNDPIVGGPARDTDGNLLTNTNFPDMKALTNYIHSCGLKAGIYIGPGPLTCGGFEASYHHEEQDARLFAKWGFDFLKYDMCSYLNLVKDNQNVEELRKPYQLMGSILPKLNRDFIYNLCQYGMGKVWEWGREVGGHFWRTTGDVGDGTEKGLWASMQRIGFGQAGIERWAGPGGWNDPDNILIGYILWQRKLVPTPLTHNEQYTWVTLWSLMDSPLIFGGDMTKLDDFTLSLLTNDEVFDVNQDAAGKQASPVYKSGDLEVWAKDLEDGTKAIGLFNRGEGESEVVARWSDLSITGQQVVRDLWRQMDVGQFDREFRATVGRHGAAMFRLRPASARQSGDQ
jgi:alpha-galactosidase